MPGIYSSAFDGIPAADFSLKGLADELGIHREAVVAIKGGRRALSVDIARAVAAKSESGEKPGNIYLRSQVNTIRGKIAAKNMTPAGCLSACKSVMEDVS